MIRTRIAALVPLLGLAGVTSAAAPPALDLAEHARVTASGVRSDRRPGWIRDELDGPATVRDGEAATGWAPLPEGAQWLLLDFAWRNPSPFVLEQVDLHWAPPPQGEVVLRFGPDPETLDPVTRTTGETRRVRPTGSPTGRYLRLELTDPGPDARLVEIEVRGRGADSPAAPDLSATAERDGTLQLGWSAVDLARTHHLELHRSRDAGFRPSAASLVGVVSGTSSELVAPRSDVTRGLEVALVAVGFDGSTAEADPRLHQVTALDPESPVPRRGVIEGFYGRPWPHRQRLALIRTLAELNLNLYAWAPKDAPKHRAAWRELHTLAELERFAELLAAGVRHGVAVAYTISPGLSLDPDADTDVATLLAKLDPLIDIGFRDFGLLMDDIPVRPDAAVGAAHVRLVTQLKAHLLRRVGRSVRLFFVPTVYSGRPEALAEAPREYLAALAALPDDVPVIWTGPRVFSRQIPGATAADLRALLGGQPLWLWDNYPVNDADRRRDLYLGAIRGRDIDLFEQVNGVLINPMVQGAASRIPIRAYGDLLRSPDEYDPAGSFRRALAAEAGTGDRACLTDLAGFFTGSERVDTHARDAAALDAALDDLDAARARSDARGFRAAALELARLLARAWRTATCLPAGLPRLDLADDLQPAARAVAAIGRDGLLALRLVQARRFGEATSSLAADVRRARAAVHQQLWSVGGGIHARLLDSALDASGDVRRLPPAARPHIAADPPATARVGEPVRFRVRAEPPQAEVTLHLVGPAGMRLDQRGRVTWVPTVAGPRRFVILAASAGGVEVLPSEVVVAPADPDAAMSGAGRRRLLTWLAAGLVALALAALVRRQARRGRSAAS